MPMPPCSPVSIAILTLVPTPSVAATSTGSLEAGGVEEKPPAEPADLGVGSGAGGGADHRLDQIDQPVAGIDIDARIRVSEPVFAVVHAQFQMMTAGYEEFRDPAMARKRGAHILCR